MSKVLTGVILILFLFLQSLAMAAESVKLYTCQKLNSSNGEFGYGYDKESAQNEFLNTCPHSNFGCLMPIRCEQIEVILNHPFLIKAQQVSPAALGRTQALLQQLIQVSRKTEDDQLKVLNKHINERIQFHEDLDNWKVADYWSGVQELLNIGRGDCEDYAIAKYFSLVASGVSDKKLRLVRALVEQNNQQVPHMVLAYFHNESTADPLILDNLTNDILSLSSRRDLKPEFSFNAEGVWYKTGQPVDVARPLKWIKLVEKVHAEGWSSVTSWQ